MILLAAIVPALALVALSPARRRCISSWQVRNGGLALAGVVSQTVVISVVPDRIPEALAVTVHVVSYLLVSLFVLRNLRMPWLWLVWAGGLGNFAAIVANGGVMPASHAAVVAAGRGAQDGFVNSGEVAGAHLAWLGDVFAVPARFPLANVFSVGDVVIVVGVWLLVLRGTRTPAASPAVAPAAPVVAFADPSPVRSVSERPLRAAPRIGERATTVAAAAARAADASLLRPRAGRPPVRHRLTRAEMARAADALRAGRSTDSIAAELGVRPATVELCLGRSVEPQLAGLAAEQVAEASRLRSAGLSLTAVGRRYGVDGRTIAAALRHAGLDVREATRRHQHGHPVLAMVRPPRPVQLVGRPSRRG